MTDPRPSPTLDEYAAMWWRLESGDHQNLFDEARDRLVQSEKRCAELEAENRKLAEVATVAVARCAELADQVSALYDALGPEAEEILAELAADAATTQDDDFDVYATLGERLEDMTMQRDKLCEVVANERVRLEQSEERCAELARALTRIQAAVAFVYPDDMTPPAKMMFDEILDDALAAAGAATTPEGA